MRYGSQEEEEEEQGGVSVPCLVAGAAFDAVIILLSVGISHP